MARSAWLSCVSVLVLNGTALAQTEQPVTPAAAAPATSDAVDEIVVTATKRAQTLSSVPIAVSAVSSTQLQNTGAVDIRGLNQISPSLLVSSTTSESVGGVARIRGIGTVGDNPGLESSVATFIDGVYRNRSGVALSELGDVERIEVLRGPQGTLFGRNASAGLINIITKGPEYEAKGNAEVSYGNYDYWRIAGGVTGPIGSNDTIAYRLDGVYTKRDGFLKDVVSGRRINNRDRWLTRGQLLFEPTSDLRVRVIADYAKRDEECCAATLQPASDMVRTPSGAIVTQPSSVAALEQAQGAIVLQNPYARQVTVTPGQDYRSDVRDWGLSAEVNYDFGAAKLTSITAYRDWQSKRGQDADFSSLDLIDRTRYNQEFKTFTQEFRLQGDAFDGKLDWLIGAYYANEKLNLSDDLGFGSQYGLFQACQVVGAAAPALGIPASLAIRPASPGCFNPALAPGLSGALGPLAAPLFAGLNRMYGISNVAIDDRLRQKSENYAFFTHNVFNVTDRLSVTLGLRWTHDKKSVNARFLSDNSACAVQQASLAGIRDNATLPAAARTLAGNLITLSCLSNIGTTVDGTYADSDSNSQWSGTAVISYKPTDALMAYASYSKGYKAGGFNLDRSGLNPNSINVHDLRFAPEKVDAYEIGAKLRMRSLRLSAALFYQEFDDFQLNTFNGISFIVENIVACKGTLSPVIGQPSSIGTCNGKTRPGVVSKGVELEAALFPAEDLSVDAGFTYADTTYRKKLVGAGGRPLPAGLALLPGSRLSNAPEFVVTTGFTYTPEVSASGIRALLHADMRYMSDFNTGSDLFPEKRQDSVTTVNARIGIIGPDKAWSLEFWGQNLLKTNYTQTIANAPGQGSGSAGFVQNGYAASATQLFINFPAEPRTYGVTVRTTF